MKSKIGFHIDIQGHQGAVEKMIASETRIIKVISSMGMLRDLHNELGDKTIFIARDWKVTDDFLRFGGRDNPKQAARDWFEAMRPSIVQAPYAYWESFNEMSNWDSMAQYGEFEAERQRIMAHEGFRCCIGNFATGTPAISDYDGDDREDFWPGFYPALETAHELGNVLGMHEYGGLWMDLWYGPNQHDELIAGNRVPFPEERYEGWLFGRYRKVWRRHIAPNGWTNIRFALTEFGLDMAGTYTTDKLAGYTVGSWNTAGTAWHKLDGRQDPEQYYVEQLQWCDRQMQKDPFILGATIFTWGTLGSLWRNFEIEGPVADKLIAYNTSTSGIDPRNNPNGGALSAEPWKDGDDGPTEPVVVASFYLTPTPSEGLLVRSGPGTQYDSIGTVYPGAKLGGLEQDSVILSKLGKQGQWLHIVMPSKETGYVAAWFVQRWPASEADIKPSDGEYLLATNSRAGIALKAGAGDQYSTVTTVSLGEMLIAQETVSATAGKIGQAGQWINVKTAGGREGHVPAQYIQPIHEGSERVIVYSQPYAGDDEDDSTTPVIPITFQKLFLRTTSDDGINIRSGPGSQHRPIATVGPYDKLHALGDPDDIMERLGQHGEWVQVVTPDDDMGWAAAWLLEVYPDYYEWEIGHALAGLHGPADPGAWPWDETAYLMVKQARIEAIKLVTGGDLGQQQVNRLKQEGVDFIMARLFAKFEVKRSPAQFLHEIEDGTQRLYDAGVRYFEVHNEPNLHGPDSQEGMWVAWQNGREFGEFFLQSVELLKERYPRAQFGWPGLSPGGDIPRLRYGSERFESEAEFAIEQADFYCLHAYWGGDGSSYLAALTRTKEACERWPGKLIFVTEFSNNHKSIAKDIKGREYAQFFTDIRTLQPNLGAAFSYVLSASEGYAHETWRDSQIAALVGNRKS